MSANNISQEEFPSWRAIEDTGAGDGLPTECERCGKSGTPRQQFQHMGVTVCADERVAELGSGGTALSQSETFSGRAHGGRH